VSQSYFDLFDVDAKFSLELATFEANYRRIQSATHPDRFVSATASEKLAAMQQATLANEAYQTLKNPARRAKYLLELQGIAAISETNTAMPAEFLMQQMEWREALEDAKAAKDIAALEALLNTLRSAAKTLQSDLADLLDTKKDYINATGDARKLIFIDKVAADINQAIEQLET
jgi:molecular chaperone HscB